MKNEFSLDKLVRPNVLGMAPYSSARDEFKELETKMIFIDANENPFENGLNRYPDPQQNKVKERLSVLKNIRKSQILLGNGSDEILDLIFRAFCEPQRDNVVLMPPTYGMYKVLANLNDIRFKEVLLTEEFQLNVEGILGNVDDSSKLIFICSPNNPTGNKFYRTDIEKILQNFNGLVVIDEAYIDFSDEPSWTTELKTYPNLIVTQTFSKALGMAAIRLGICFASEDIIQILNKIKPPYNVNGLTQNAALKVLNSTQESIHEINEIKLNKNLLINNLNKNNFVKKIYPSDANFVLVKVDNADKRYHQFLQNNIVTRNRTKEPLCENCLRFSIGIREEVEKMIAVMNKMETE